MPLKNKDAKHAYDKGYNSANCKLYTIKVRNDSGIPQAMENMKLTGQTTNSYIIESLKEKLIRDGYMKPKE